VKFTAHRRADGGACRVSIVWLLVSHKRASPSPPQTQLRPLTKSPHAQPSPKTPTPPYANTDRVRPAKPLQAGPSDRPRAPPNRLPPLCRHKRRVRREPLDRRWILHRFDGARGVGECVERAGDGAGERLVGWGVVGVINVTCGPAVGSQNGRREKFATKPDQTYQTAKKLQLLKADHAHTHTHAHTFMYGYQGLSSPSATNRSSFAASRSCHSRPPFGSPAATSGASLRSSVIARRRGTRSTTSPCAMGFFFSWWGWGWGWGGLGWVWGVEGSARGFWRKVCRRVCRGRLLRDRSMKRVQIIEPSDQSVARTWVQTSPLSPLTPSYSAALLSGVPTPCTPLATRKPKNRPSVSGSSSSSSAVGGCWVDAACGASWLRRCSGRWCAAAAADRVAVATRAGPFAAAMQRHAACLLLLGKSTCLCDNLQRPE